jgi:hypothetical protein
VFAFLVGGSALLIMPGGSNSVNRDPHRAAIAIAGLAGALAFAWTLIALGSGRARFDGHTAVLLMISAVGALFFFLSSAIA